MLRRVFSASMTLLAGTALVQADTIQMKDSKATITGSILAEKRDQVVVDVGFTLLVVPRNQIKKITRDAAPEPATEIAPVDLVKPEPAELRRGLYQYSRNAPPVQTVRELVNLVGEAVVQVKTPSGLGSGFIIDEEGFLITNFHVIEGETQISVEVYHQKSGQLERKTYKEVRIVAMNKFKDLALLKIDDKDAPKFTRVLLGDTGSLSVGERVFAVGSPLGLERTVTEGILSTKTRQLQGELYLQTTAQINPGNSGGPLFNTRGEVMGVTNMKITFGEGLGFAIPVEAVKFFLEQRDAFTYATDNPSNPYRYLDPPSRTRISIEGE